MRHTHLCLKLGSCRRGFGLVGHTWIPLLRKLLLIDLGVSAVDVAVLDHHVLHE